MLIYGGILQVDIVLKIYEYHPLDDSLMIRFYGKNVMNGQNLTIIQGGRKGVSRYL